METLTKRIYPEIIRDLRPYPTSMVLTIIKNISWQPLLLLLALLLLWFFLPGWMHEMDAATGTVDQSIWLLIILSLISFVITVGLCWWLLQQFLLYAGLPSLLSIFSLFKLLSLWQQFILFWASFALLLLAALMCLIAIC